MSYHDYSTDPSDPQNGGRYLPIGWEWDIDGEEEAHPVDKIAIRKLGGFNFINPQQWVNLPRASRERLLRRGSVVFLYEGEDVSVRAALLYFQTISSPHTSWAGEGTGFTGLDMGTPQPGEI